MEHTVAPQSKISSTHVKPVINYLFPFQIEADAKCICKIFPFQIATDAKGRGVLRLLLVQQQINLLCIPAICIQLFMVSNPTGEMPHVVCIALEVLYTIIMASRTVSDMAVVMGR